MTAYTKQAALINGLEEMPVEDISFNDIWIQAETGFIIRKAKNIELHNVVVNVQKGSAIVTENTNGIELDAVKTNKPLTGVPVIAMTNTENAFIRNCRPVAGTDIFLQLKGKQTNHILLQGNSFDLVKKAIEKAGEVTGTVIQQ